MKLYLDSSALIKRYLSELGSSSVDIIYHTLERQEGSNVDGLVFSAWNLGEIYGAVDFRRKKGTLTESEMKEALSLFSLETRKFIVMRKIRIIPVGARILAKSRDLVLKYHIFQADALQLASAQASGAKLLLSSDKRLLECAKSEGQEVLNPERDSDLILKVVSK